MAGHHVPIPTPIYRIVHTDNLSTLIQRRMLHAPSTCPNDGLPYIGIHAVRTQADRGNRPVTCGPRGAIRDYVGFYFGPRSPMLYRLHTGWNVTQVDQSNIVYLVSNVQAVAGAGIQFVFTDRHSLANVAAFLDRLDCLNDVDFATANAAQWNATADQPDRQEKKQAEFLVYRSMPWPLIEQIGVLNREVKERVEVILEHHAVTHRPIVNVQRNWYY